MKPRSVLGEREVGPRERIHYSDAPIALDTGRRYEQEFGLKPRGLWYSAPVKDDGWEDWCRAEEFSVERLVVPHHLDLDLSRMLVLRSESEIRRFHSKYRHSRYEIDWPRVAAEYGGLEIAPYCWDLRLEGGFLWYYGWDCASGCVWDLRLVRSFAALAATERKASKR